MFHLTEKVVVFVEVVDVHGGGGHHAVNKHGIVTVLRGGGDKLCVDGVKLAEDGQPDILAHPALLDLLGAEGAVLERFHLVDGEHIARIAVDRALVVGEAELIDGPG